MYTEYFNVIITDLKAWAKNPADTEPPKPDHLNALTMIAIRAIYDHAYEDLKTIRSVLLPIGDSLYNWIEDIPLNKRKAFEVAMLSILINSILFIMETRQDNLTIKTKL